QHQRGLGQSGVPGRSSVARVERREVVEIDDHEPERLTMSLGAPQLLLEPRVETARIGQACDRVATRSVAETLQLDAGTERRAERAGGGTDQAQLRRLPGLAGSRAQVENPHPLAAPFQRNADAGAEIAGTRLPITAGAPGLDLAVRSERVEGHAVAL